MGAKGSRQLSSEFRLADKLCGTEWAQVGHEMGTENLFVAAATIALQSDCRKKLASNDECHTMPHCALLAQKPK